MADKPLEYETNRTGDPAGVVRNRRRLVLVLVLVGVISFVVAILVPSTSRHKEASYSRCANHLRQIGQAIQIYAGENAGIYPPDFATLLPVGLSAETFICQRAKDTPGSSPWSQPGHCSYVYVGASLTTAANPDCIVAFDDPGSHVGVVLFADGHVDELPLPELMTAINDLKAGHKTRHDVGRTATSAPRLTPDPPTSKTTFTQATAEQDYKRNWQPRIPQLKSAPWVIPATRPAAAPTTSGATPAHPE